MPNEREFRISERHGNEPTDLVVKIHTVDQRQGSQGIQLFGNPEEVTLHELTVTRSEGAAQTGVVGLDQAFDSCVLDHIQVVLSDGTILGVDSVACRPQRIRTLRSVEGMAHFVTDEHIVGIVVHFPQGKRQSAILNIEHGSGCFRINLHIDVFSSHEAG